MADMVNLRQYGSEPVILASARLVEHEGGAWAVVRSEAGDIGAAPANQHARHLARVFAERVVADCIGRDARDLPQLIESAYRSRSSYKYGFAFWNAAAWLDQAVLDLLGRIDGVPVSAYLGKRQRDRLPVYLSSLKRNTTPQEEVDWLGQRLAETDATAIKVKIGGRMSHNADATPGRSEQLVALARQTFGDDVAIYVDANGSYDADAAIDVGRMLQDHGVAWFEEPCPFEAIDWTRRVADALDMPVAGGEQDHSHHVMRMLVEQRAVDVLQPDVAYCGGLLRARAICTMANAAGVPVAPHAPRTGPGMAATAQLLSVIDRPMPHVEYRADASASRSDGPLYVRDGAVTVPDAPGLGAIDDPAPLGEAPVIT